MVIFVRQPRSATDNAVISSHVKWSQRVVDTLLACYCYGTRHSSDKNGHLWINALDALASAEAQTLIFIDNSDNSDNSIKSDPISAAVAARPVPSLSLHLLHLII
jgi:arginine deiminase